MKALRVEENGIAVREVDLPDRGSESLVRVVLSGICNTDLEIARGYAGFRGTIGHEFVGVVEEADDHSLVGQRVVGEINAGCGKCDLCRSGDPRHCATRTVLGIHGRDGSHAEFLKLPTVNLFQVPDKVADEQAVFVEPLAAAYGITERVSLDDDQQVAIIGDGKLGLLCAQAIALTGAAVTLFGKHPEKMRIAERRGIETMNANESSTRNRAFDVVVEASGSSSGFMTALDLLRPRGTLVLKSTFHGTTDVPSEKIVVDEISVVGSRCGRFGPALELLKKGAIDVDSLISEEHPLADGVTAMKRAETKGVLKVLLRA